MTYIPPEIQSLLQGDAAQPQTNTPLGNPQMGQQSSHKDMLKGLLSNFMFSLGQGLQASGQATPQNAMGAGLGASLQAPEVLRQQQFKEQQMEQQAEMERQRLAQYEAQGQREAAMLPYQQGNIVSQITDRAKAPILTPEQEKLQDFLAKNQGKGAWDYLQAVNDEEIRKQGGIEGAKSKYAMEEIIAKAQADAATKQEQNAFTSSQNTQTQQAAMDRLQMQLRQNAQLAAERNKATIDAAALRKTGTRPSATENSSFAFWNRGQTAHEDAVALEGWIKGLNIFGQSQLRLLPNVMQSENGQLYRQAQRVFTEARLRKESGAAIAQSEYDNDSKMYFAQPGDTPKVVEKKTASRLEVLNGLKKSAGRAYDESFPEGESVIIDLDEQGNIKK
jgi:hypothetical protein